MFYISFPYRTIYNIINLKRRIPTGNSCHNYYHVAAERNKKKKILNCEWTDFCILENPEIFHGLRWTLSALIVQRW